jgi:type II secretory ATPase GspE/PulE/Tfp pilus assembly ATPase PilB-like protein
MILVTGPTGSGKSTTLYAALQEIDASQLNVVTIEDPIEYQLSGISQTQVNVKKGLTFASGLRSVLRQDPDIILVGEIRDRETAEMAIQSALTGHLVLSTLHTNDSASAITRLLDLGIEPYLAASCLVGILAQRLVRKNCPSCKTLVNPPSEDLFSLGLSGSADNHFYAGIGCRSCRGTGYMGRFAVCELLTVSESIRDLIQRRATASEILTKGASEGLTTMREDGIRRVLAGETTCAEVARVTVGDLVES